MPAKDISKHIHSLPPRREPDYEAIDPETAHFFEDPRGWTRLTIEDDRSYLDVKVIRAFPHSEPDRYYAVIDTHGPDFVIGVINDPGKLDKQSREIVRKLLQEHYFVPVIQRIDEFREEFGAVYCDVQTDRGPRHFVLRGVRDQLIELDNGEILIPDVDGNRYLIHDWRAMDSRSREFIGRIV